MSHGDSCLQTWKKTSQSHRNSVFVATSNLWLTVYLLQIEDKPNRSKMYANVYIHVHILVIINNCQTSRLVFLVLPPWLFGGNYFSDCNDMISNVSVLIHFDKYRCHLSLEIYVIHTYRYARDNEWKQNDLFK